MKILITNISVYSQKALQILDFILRRPIDCHKHPLRNHQHDLTVMLGMLGQNISKGEPMNIMLNNKIGNISFI